MSWYRPGYTLYLYITGSKIYTCIYINTKNISSCTVWFLLFTTLQSFGCFADVGVWHLSVITTELYRNGRFWICKSNRRTQDKLKQKLNASHNWAILLVLLIELYIDMDKATGSQKGVILLTATRCRLQKTQAANDFNLKMSFSIMKE